MMLAAGEVRTDLSAQTEFDFATIIFEGVDTDRIAMSVSELMRGSDGGDHKGATLSLAFGSDPGEADPSVAQRRRWAREDKALPDGSYPIPDVAYLKRAIRSFGRAKNKARVKAWIKKRALALKRPDLIPDSWGSGSS